MPDWLSFVLLGFVVVVVCGFMEWILLKLFDKRWPDESRANDTLPVPGMAAAGYVAASLILGGVGFFTENYYVFGAIVPVVGMFYVCVFRTHRRRKRKKLGLCVKCGYDLRGSKDRCPECGTGFSN